MATFVPSAAANANSSPIKITPITGEFDQEFYETTYHTLISLNGPLTGKARDDVKIEWTLKLELVDKAGAPDPEMTAMRMASGAEVDLGCTNGGVEETTELLTLDSHNHLASSSFEWHHPDAQDSVPSGRYHCNHALQGPHGHQGLITVTVSDAKWTCVATFKGTHSSIPDTDTRARDPNVRDGTASEPTCRKN